MRRSSLAIIIPAHNEELVISYTLEALLKEIKSKHVYFIDDGSKDQTALIAKRYLPTSRVLSIKNGGKAHAISTAIEEFKLTQKYKYIMIHDADTQMQKDFVKNTLKIFQDDKNQKIACVMGQVITDDHNWLTSYRVWEYSIGQSVHKQAQSLINAITVSPGCSSVYRWQVFDQLKMPIGTLTEDMDLTFEIHRKNLGKLVYQPQAKMKTQDPETIKNYYLQIQRWYGGFWQCVFKHNIPWGGQKLDFEVGLMALEGLLQPFIFFLSLAIGIKYHFFQSTEYSLLTFLIIDLFGFVFPTILWSAYATRKYKLPIYIFHFYFLRTFSGIVFLYTFIREVHRFGLKQKSSWTTARYELDDSLTPDGLLLNNKKLA